MTAAHCFKPGTTRITAFVGAISKEVLPDNEEVADVLTHYQHPGFNPNTFANDIMLLKLDMYSSFGPVKLNEDPAFPSTGDSVDIIGLGLLERTEGGTSNKADVLQIASVGIVSNKVCKREWPFINPDLVACAILPGQGPCRGDSGGPLIYQEPGQPDSQIGIVSFGPSEGCALSRYSDGYTRISGYKDWIDQELCDIAERPPEYCFPNPNPTSSPIVGGGACFSGHNMVQVKDKGAVWMKDLRIGDYVEVSGNNFEAIYSFAHYDPTGSSSYLQISTTSAKKPLEMTPNHLLFVHGRGFVPASSVQVGDVLLSDVDTLKVSVTSIMSKSAVGVFAPLTPSGTIVVNDVLASTYVSLQTDSASLRIGRFPTGLKYQWLEHAFLAPARIVSHYSSPGESYDAEGIATWAVLARGAAQWWLNLQPLFVMLILAPMLVVLSAFVVAEWLAANIFVLFATFLLLLSVYRSDIKMKAKLV